MTDVRPSAVRPAETSLGVSRRCTEAELVAQVAAELRGQVELLCEEVPILGRSADLVFYLDGTLVSMEFKRSNWRRAVYQASDHRLAADYSYICMPWRRVNPEMVECLRAAGVGLAFAIPGEHPGFAVAIEAPRSDHVWPPARRAVEAYLGQHGTRCSIADQ